MTRLRSTRACNEDGSVTVQTSARLMDDYVYASDIDDAADLISVQESDGSYSLLYIGTGSKVRALRQDDTSDTGWLEEELPPGCSARQVAAAVDGGGNLVVFAVGPNLLQPDIYTAIRTAGEWSSWTRVALDDNVPLSTYVQKLAAVTVGGSVGVWTILGPSRGSRGSSVLWQVAWHQDAPTWTRVARTDRTILEPCTIAGSGPSLLFANTAAGDPRALDLSLLPIGGAGEPPRPLAQTVMLTTLAVGRQGDGNSAVFIADKGTVSGVRQIQYLDGAKPAEGFRQIDTETAASRLLVMAAGTTPLTLFALHGDSVLHLIADPTAPTPGDNFDFSLKLELATTVTNSQGGAELVGYITGKGMQRLWVDRPGGWSQAAIEYQPLNSNLKQISTYAATLTFYNAAGVPITNRDLHLRSSMIAPASIRGETLLLGPEPVTVTTDRRGQVRVTLPTGALGAPVLSATLPGLMPAGEDFAVSPDAGMKNRLAAITVEEVSQFIDPRYNDPDTVEAVQQHVQATMANIGNAPFPTVRARKNSRQDLKTVLQGGSGPCHSLRVENGKAVFTLLTPEQAQAQMGAIASTAADLGGIFDWFEDAVEAIGQAVLEAAEWTYTNVVCPVEEGIKVAFNFVCGAVTVAWDGILDTIEDAFRFVESVFDAVGTFFERIYNFFAWLLTDAARDIWATKQYFDNLLTSSFVELAGYAEQGVTVVDGFFTQLEGQVDELFAKIENAVGLDDPNQAINAGPSGAADGVGETFLEIIEDASSVAGWLFDKVADAAGLNPTVSLPTSLMSGAGGLVTDLVAALSGAETLAENFLKQLQELATSTADFGSAALKTILGAVKDFLIGILKLLDSVVTRVVQFLADNLPAIVAGLIGASLGGGLLEALYNAINPGSPETLTLQGLGCLVFGFVTTILYKAITDEVPIPPGVESAALDSPSGQIMWAGLIQCTVWNFYDFIADVSAVGKVPIPLALNVAFGILGPTLILALDPPAGTPSSDNIPALAAWSAWFSGFLGITFNTFAALDSAAGILKGGLRSDLSGSMILAACGLATLGTNIWSAIENDADALGWIGAVAGPLSAIGKPAMHLIKEPDTAVVVMLIIDFVSNMGSGVAKIARGSETLALSSRKTVLAPTGI